MYEKSMKGSVIKIRKWVQHICFVVKVKQLEVDMVKDVVSVSITIKLELNFFLNLC